MRRCIAIRREDFNVWERRAPLAPCHVRQLNEHGFKVIVQPSGRRINPIHEYVEAGAEVSEDLKEADLITGVKSVALDDVYADKAYLIYSHTIKAQKENMPMLDEMLKKRVALFDHELLTDERGIPLGLSSRYAGRAGMLDILNGLGTRLLALGFNTPFLDIALPQSYPTYDDVLKAVNVAGKTVEKYGLPKEISPFVVAFTGTGNVSKGAQDVFKVLPHEFITVDQLPEITKTGSNKKVYGVVVDRGDHLTDENGRPLTDEYDLKKWYEDKSLKLRSSFPDKIAPYITVLVNGISWASHHPRLISYEDAKKLLKPTPKKHPSEQSVPHKLLAVSDVSADIEGGVQFNTLCTTFDRPFYVYDAVANKATDDLAHPHGCLVCSIEQMPTQLALEATRDFGDALMPFILEMVKCDAKTPFENWPVSDRIRKAAITANGKLTPNYAYIDKLRKLPK